MSAASKLSHIGVQSVRIWDYDAKTLAALSDSGIKDVYITVPNGELPQLADGGPLDNVADKIAEVVQLFDSRGMKFIIGVGNEPTAPWEYGRYDKYLVKGLLNLQAALSKVYLAGKVRLSVVLDLSIFANSYPPRAGEFVPGTVADVVGALHRLGGVFTVNAYPYFALKSGVPLSKALGGGNVIDGRVYHGILHQQIAAVRAALTRLDPDYATMPLVVGESGWPSAGEAEATRANACRYTHSMLANAAVLDPHLRTLYVFSAFDEPMKSAAGHGGSSRKEEDHFGLFYKGGNSKFEGLSFECDSSISDRNGPAGTPPDASPNFNAAVIHSNSGRSVPTGMPADASPNSTAIVI